jgi:hypothetical protein
MARRGRETRLEGPWSQHHLPVRQLYSGRAGPAKAFACRSVLFLTRDSGGRLPLAIICLVKTRTWYGWWKGDGTGWPADTGVGHGAGGGGGALSVTQHKSNLFASGGGVPGCGSGSREPLPHSLLRSFEFWWRNVWTPVFLN